MSIAIRLLRCPCFFLRALFVGALVAVPLFLSCRAAPAPDSGFLTDTAKLRPQPNDPFDAAWFAPGEDFRKYQTVYIAPVDTQHLEKLDWWQKLDTAELTKDFNPAAESKYLATYFQQQVQAAINDINLERVVSNSATPDSLVIELALVEVVPTKAWLNSISYVLIGAVDTGSTAMEGRVRRGPNGPVIASFKDREFGQMSIASIADLQWYSHAHHTIDSWSAEIAEVISLPPDAAIDPPLPVTLRPW